MDEEPVSRAARTIDPVVLRATDINAEKADLKGRHLECMAPHGVNLPPRGDWIQGDDQVAFTGTKRFSSEFLDGPSFRVQ
jgi:hypothetical protein